MRRRWMSGVMAAGLLLGAAACGSDEDSGDSGDTTVATSATGASGDTETSMSDGTATEEPTASTGGGDAGSEVDLSGLSEAQAQVVTDNLEAAEAAGVDIDEQCFVDAVAQLSDEDAEKIAAAGPDGDPDISPEGEAAGVAASECIIIPEIEDTTTTAAG